MSFQEDYILSRKKDGLMKDIWKALSYEGRYVIAGSEFIQKTMGVDVILQGKDNIDILVDTKNAKGVYAKLLLEEMSCPARGTKGWLLKENMPTDFLFFTFWTDLNFERGYYVPYQPLRDWFILNHSKYEFTQSGQINRSTARLVPISEIIYNIKGIKFIIRENGKAMIIDADSQSTQKRVQNTFDF